MITLVTHVYPVVMHAHVSVILMTPDTLSLYALILVLLRNLLIFVILLVERMVMMGSDVVRMEVVCKR